MSMEKIPVRRKEQTPWWIWLIVALIVLGLIWAIFEALDNEEAAAVAPVPTAAISDQTVVDPTPAFDDTDEAAAVITPVPTTIPRSPTPATGAASPVPAAAGEQTDTDQTMLITPEPLTDLAFLLTAPDPEALIGRRVTLENVRVLSVPGDVAFWVGPNANEQLLVILDETATPGDPTTEGRYDINPGQIITIYGEARAFPGVEEAIEQWNVSDEQLLEQQSVYVNADQIEIISR